MLLSTFNGYVVKSIKNLFKWQFFMLSSDSLRTNNRLFNTYIPLWDHSRPANTEGTNSFNKWLQDQSISQHSSNKFFDKWYRMIILQRCKQAAYVHPALTVGRMPHQVIIHDLWSFLGFRRDRGRNFFRYSSCLLLMAPRRFLQIIYISISIICILKYITRIVCWVFTMHKKYLWV